MRYCGDECRDEHWREHRPVCPWKPSAAVLKEAPRKTYACGMCGTAVAYEAGHDRESSGKKGCARCRAVFYCSARCQRAHWPAHMPECVAFKAGWSSDEDSDSEG